MQQEMYYTLIIERICLSSETKTAKKIFEIFEFFRRGPWDQTTPLGGYGSGCCGNLLNDVLYNLAAWCKAKRSGSAIMWCVKVCGKPRDAKVEEKAASWNGENLFTDLGNVGGCIASDGHCTDSYGTIICDEAQFQIVCPVVFNGNTARAGGTDCIIVTTTGSISADVCG
uniref:Uncharacterized protein n=1 Tax=Romanomermis culicivorax TaxID=13658 RepID=A0A915IFG9_ROMCU